MYCVLHFSCHIRLNQHSSSTRLWSCRLWDKRQFNTGCSCDRVFANHPWLLLAFYYPNIFSNARLTTGIFPFNSIMSMASADDSYNERSLSEVSCKATFVRIRFATSIATTIIPTSFWLSAIGTFYTCK